MYLDRLIIRSVECPQHTGRIYVSIFDQHANAITFSGAPYQLATYASAAANKFVYPIGLDSERAHYYMADVPSASIVLAENAYGERYTKEWWAESVSGTINRSADKLIAFENFIWSSERYVDAKLDINQEDKLADLIKIAVFTGEKASSDYVPDSWGEYLSELGDNFGIDVWGTLSGGFLSGGTFGHILNNVASAASRIPTEPSSANWVAMSAVGYNATAQTLTIMCHLEKDGALQTDATEARYIMYDDEGTVVVDVTIPEPVGPLAGLGMFPAVASSVTLLSDATYFATVIMKDADDVSHVSANSPVTWD